MQWNEYEGFIVSQYRILRDSTGLELWEVYDSVPSGNITFTDINPPASNTRYVVEAVPPDVCIATTAKVYQTKLQRSLAKNFEKSRSNYADRITTGINETSNNPFELRIFPNPYTGKTQISYSLKETADVTLEVLNVLGEKIRTIVNKKQDKGSYSYEFSGRETGFNKGVYILKFKADEKTFTKLLLEL